MLNLKSSHSTAFTPSSPAERYAEALASGQFMADEAQAQAVQELDRVWKELLNRYKASKKAFRRFRRQTSPKGVYMWGGVGRGKTWLWINFMSLYHFAVKHVCIFITLCNMFIKS
jgi:cell division protein ZapE